MRYPETGAEPVKRERLNTTEPGCRRKQKSSDAERTEGSQLKKR